MDFYLKKPTSLFRLLSGGMFLGLLLLSSVFATQALAADRDTLRVTAIPDESPTELQRKFEPLVSTSRRQPVKKSALFQLPTIVLQLKRL